MSTNANIFLDNEFGSRLKSERLRLGMTQESFAAAGGVRRPTQYLYEQNERVPTVEYLAGIAKAGADFRFLITGERSALTGGKICLTDEVLSRAFAMVDEHCRDDRGRLIDLEYRLSLMLALCKAAADSGNEMIDWDNLYKNLSA